MDGSRVLLADREVAVLSLRRKLTAALSPPSGSPRVHSLSSDAGLGLVRCSLVKAFLSIDVVLGHRIATAMFSIGVLSVGALLGPGE